MKKTQILSAIALAFALGVVAPLAVVENASAVVVEGKTNQEYINGEVAAVKAKFGNVEIHKNVGDITTEVVDGYGYYEDAAEAIAKAQNYVSNAKKAAAGTLKTAVAGAITDSALTMSDAIQAELDGDDWDAGTDFDAVSTITNQVLAFFKGIKEGTASGTYTTEQRLAADTAVATIEEAIETAAESIDTVVKNSTNTMQDVADIAAELTNTTVAKPNTVAELNAAIATINSKLPMMATYLRVSEVIAKIPAVAGYTDRQVKQMADALWAAYNGTTPEVSIDEIVKETEDTKAPNTGIVGTAEGTATTVSIVAGLATALTALGAGVVAYRSARRK